MTEQHNKLEVTPRIIDLGDCVIQLRHVVSVGWRAGRPFRPGGLAALGLGLLAIASASLVVGRFPPDYPDSLLFWAGLALCVAGLAMVLFVRRTIAIQTVDGKRLELPAPTQAAATAIILRIRHAMEPATVTATGVGQSPEAIVFPSKQTVEKGPEAAVPPAEPASTPPETPVEVKAETADETPAKPAAEPATRETGDDATVLRTMPAGRHGAVYANGHAGGHDMASRSSDSAASEAETSSLKEQAVKAYRRAGLGVAIHQASVATAAGEGSAPAEEAGPRLASMKEQLALPAALPVSLVPDDGMQDLKALIEHVRGSDVQHKEALLDLLQVVEDHYHGRANREDAIAHWRSFADYVVQYLGDVEGLLAATEKFGRHMLGR